MTLTFDFMRTSKVNKMTRNKMHFSTKKNDAIVTITKLSLSKKDKAQTKGKIIMPEMFNLTC